MIMLGVSARVIGIVVKGQHAALIDNREAARHAQMHDQGFFGAEIGNKIFRASVEALHCRSFKALDKLGWKGKAQVWAAGFNADKGLALQSGL